MGGRNPGQCELVTVGLLPLWGRPGTRLGVTFLIGRHDKEGLPVIRILRFLGLLALVVGGASADEYWFAYEATDRFPEQEGWRRITTGGGAVRSLENGQLIIDGRAGIEITDRYEMNLGGNLDPDPGELFVARWRLRLDEVLGFADPTVSIRSDDNRAVAFLYYTDSVFNLFDPSARSQLTPGIFHEFEFRSADMRSYELDIDGRLAITGEMMPTVLQSRVSWGDSTQGATSLASWDFFRFGVVPEPSTFFMAAFALLSRRPTA